MIYALEVWLRGTHNEVQTAAAALDAIGRVENRGAPSRLSGEDAGRLAQYLRIAVRIGGQP